MINSALIVGYGSIGQRHRQVLSELFPKCRIDIVSEHLEKVDGIFGSIAEIHDISSYDYYIVASKTSHHFSDLCTLDNSVSGKNILVEKPLFMDMHVYTESLNRIYVGYNLRYHPVLSELKRRANNKNILSMSVNVGQYLPSWRPETDYSTSYSASAVEGGGVLLDLSHEIDYLQWICGKIESLRAINTRISNLKIDSDDYASIIGWTDRGIVVSITMDYLSRDPLRRITMQCEHSTVFADIIKNNIREVDDVGQVDCITLETIERNSSYRAMHYDIVEGDEKLACTLREGQDVMNTIEKVRKHAKEDWIA